MDVTLPPLTREDFEFQYDAGHTYPFFEDENAWGLYAYGDIDPAEFARLANEYDIEIGGLNPGDATYTADDVHTRWAARVDEDCLQWAPSGTPNAFPVAVLDR
ncbi:hypothetical protein SEA_BOBBY_131 [Mycobacterium phage Bobby]|nr:hypothetical protein SEA_BOBBY_131 [Mycobacterium phage Bobby]